MNLAVVSLLLPAGCVPVGLDGFVLVVNGGVADGGGAPVVGAEVELLGDTGAVMGSTTSDEAGLWSWPVYGTEPEENVLTARVADSDHAAGLARWEVSLLSDASASLRAGPAQDWQSVSRNLATVRLDTSGGGRSVRGRILDPDGRAVSGLAGIVQQGWDAAVGSAAVGSFSTAEDGTFSATVETPGLYTIYVAPVGAWAGTRFPALTTQFSEPALGTIAPLQEPGHLLASVYWAGSVDLDLHLTAPERETDAANALQRFHVWADAPVHLDRTGTQTVAALVRSADTAPGPEVIAVYTPVGEGELRLSVVDRDHLAEEDSAVLGTTGALVQWWNGEDIPRYALVSPMARATTWRPVEVDTRGGTIYAVEQYESGVDPADDDAF
jgi:hypothetical protein